MDADAEWIEAQLAPLVGLSQEQNAGSERGGATTAWRRFLEALADETPTVLVFEDLHWADDGLLDFIDDLVDRAIGVSLLVLGTARPELLDRRPGWGGGKPNALVLSLPPLVDEDTTRLLVSLFDRPLIDAAALEELLARTGGNPLYAVQYARAWREKDGLQAPPETLHALISARLDALARDEKQLLQDAAVIGSVFWLGAVEPPGAWPPDRTEELLHRLERKEFVRRVRRSSVAGEAEYAFRHVLLRDVAYGQLPRAARSERHERAAAWIEALGRSEDHAELLAHHYLRALEYTDATGRAQPPLAERARVALRAAGDRALSLASYATAWRFYSVALDLWPEDDPDRAWLLVHAGRAKYSVDLTGIELLEQGFEQLRARGDSDGAAEVAVEVARRFWLGGDRDAAYTYINRALELTKGRRNSRARAYALVERAGYHSSAAENLDAIRVLEEALPLTEALGMDELRVRALDVLGGARLFTGDLGGMEDSHRAIARARSCNAYSRLIIAELNLHSSHFFCGDLEGATRSLDEARRDIDRYATSDQRRWLRVVEAHEDVLHGRWKTAARSLNAIIAERESGRAPYYLDPACRALRASIEFGCGDLSGATGDSKAAVDGARITKDPQLLAPALVIRAMVLVAQGRREEASTLASEALAVTPVLVAALQDLAPAATTVEFAWLLRDLDRSTELLPALAVAPRTPWVELAGAISTTEIPRAVELATQLGSPSIEAYTRLHAAEQLVDKGHPADAVSLLEQPLELYRSAGATRYIRQAEALAAIASMSGSEPPIAAVEQPAQMDKVHRH
jgi:tetratricopeptide (TPR) repeat protein